MLVRGGLRFSSPRTRGLRILFFLGGGPSTKDMYTHMRSSQTSHALNLAGVKLPLLEVRELDVS